MRTQQYIKLNTEAKEIQTVNPGGPDNSKIIRPLPSHQNISLKVMFLVLHPMESISLNSFVLLEHLAKLLTSTHAINC